MVSAHSIPTEIAAVRTAPFQVPPLPYAYDALAPYIDAQTMHLHHDKHHQTYVTNLNGAIEKHPELRNTMAEELIRHFNASPTIFARSFVITRVVTSIIPCFGKVWLPIMAVSQHYQNRCADYLNAWWNVVNWDEVNKRFIQARQHS